VLDLVGSHEGRREKPLVILEESVPPG
jgi:hypothetical protein